MMSSEMVPSELNAQPQPVVGVRATATLPNGVVGTSTYDNANRLTGISWDFEARKMLTAAPNG